MSIRNYPWKSRGLCVFAPEPNEVDRFCSFIENTLVADKIDTLVLIVRYNYMFEKHPECRGDAPLSKEDVKKMVAVCRKHGIDLIPDMNLLGHQSIQGEKENDGLLRGHPEFDETPDIQEPEYSRSLCPNHPDVLPVVLSLMDEIADAFECTTFHIGMDEVFYIGLCERCKDKDKGEILAEWVNKLSSHLKQKGIKTMMWGDRLLNAFECHHGPWDASQNGTWTAMETIDKDIIITDWHYHNWPAFHSVEVFAKAGMKIYLSTFNVKENAKLFLDYAKEHDGGNILGVMETTWVSCRAFMDGMEGKEIEDISWFKDGMVHIKDCYEWLFRENKTV